jgi:hypothetical protein
MYKPHLVINRRNKYAETPGKKKQESNHVHEQTWRGGDAKQDVQQAFREWRLGPAQPKPCGSR